MKKKSDRGVSEVFIDHPTDFFNAVMIKMYENINIA
jgi:hypothetical protein